MKELLPELPSIIATFIADNAILQTRLNGIKHFINSELQCSVTLALVDNLKSVLYFYDAPWEQHIASLPVVC